MSDTLRLILAATLLALGAAAIVTAVVGVFRFRFVMNRMHCAAIIDTLGALLVLAGLMLAAGRMEYLPKLGLILVLLWVSSPIASHLVARLELSTDPTAEAHMETEEHHESV